MATTFADFDTKTTILSSDILVGYDEVASDGEKKWTYDTILHKVSADMDPQLAESLSQLSLALQENTITNIENIRNISNLNNLKAFVVFNTIGQFTTLNYYTVGSYDFIAPTGVTSISARIVGGGGGGVAAKGKGGAGGGGGANIFQIVSVTPSQTYRITVGAGGAGRLESSMPSGLTRYYAENGGSSAFGTLTAFGGGGAGSSYGTSCGTSCVTYVYDAVVGVAGGGGGGTNGRLDRCIPGFSITTSLSGGAGGLSFGRGGFSFLENNITGSEDALPNSGGGGASNSAKNIVALSCSFVSTAGINSPSVPRRGGNGGSGRVSISYVSSESNNAIIDELNVIGIRKDSDGLYTIFFEPNTFIDTNYLCIGNARDTNDSTSSPIVSFPIGGTKTVDEFQISIKEGSTGVNPTEVCLAFFSTT